MMQSADRNSARSMPTVPPGQMGSPRLARQYAFTLVIESALFAEVMLVLRKQSMYIIIYPHNYTAIMIVRPRLMGLVLKRTRLLAFIITHAAVYIPWMSCHMVFIDDLGVG